MCDLIRSGFESSMYTDNEAEFYFVSAARGVLSLAAMATVIALIVYAASTNGQSAFLSAKITGFIGVAAFACAVICHVKTAKRIGYNDVFCEEVLKTLCWTAAGPLVFCINAYKAEEYEK